jgi:hypothetical protein
MADTGIFATTAEVQRKVGASANTTANAEAYINQFMTEAESMINDATRFNWSDAYAGLNADTKGILKAAASAMAAMLVIQYDMGGYTSLAEAQTMLNVLSWQYNQAIEQLKDAKVRDFVNGTA